jgi:uncharacterized protein (UPF0332 family)
VSVDDLLAKADSRLTAPARDVDAGDVERSLSASYYAMFYAASAALEKVGVSRAKHSATIAAFGEPLREDQTGRRSLPLSVSWSLRASIRG